MLNPNDPIFGRWVLFAHSYLVYVKAVERVLTPFDLSLPQFLTLFFLAGASGPVTPSILANYLTQEPQSITSLVQRMESRGLISRSRNALDGRSSILEITADGRDLFTSCATTVFEEVIDFFSPLTEEVLDEFGDSLRTLRNQTAKRIGLDVERLDKATRQMERDPDMWTHALDIRAVFHSHN